MSRVAEILGREAIEALHRPVERSRALPAEAYTSEAFFKLEQELLFRRQWTSVAFAFQIPEPGDAMPVEAAGLPVILLRDRDGEVRAFHNACRHRGAEILAAPVKCQPTLRCPYHGWAYGLDGRLRATPLWDGRKVTPREALDRDALGLVPVRCAVFADVVFLDFSGTAPPIEEFAAPVLKQWEPFRTDELALAWYVETDLAANWKLGIEGALENYHEEFVHPSLPARLDADGNKVFRDTAEGAMFGFCWEGETALRSPTPLIRMKPEHAGPRTDYLSFLFPNTQLNHYGSVSIRVVWTPLSAGQTRIKQAFYVVKEAATAPEFEKERAEMQAYWINLREEDRLPIEAMQRGRRSPAARDFRFSPFWEWSLHNFQNKVLGAMLAAEFVPAEHVPGR